VVAQPCEARWELAFSGIVCVAPLRLGGLRGKKSTPSIGWEVPVRSSRSASERQEGAQARNNNLRLFISGYGNPKLRLYS
jgi:hypothetical protein